MPALLFLFVFLAGIWLNRTGRPPKMGISTVDKLIGRRGAGAILRGVPPQEQHTVLGDAHATEGRLFSGGCALVPVRQPVKVGYPETDRLLSGTWDEISVHSMLARR